MMILPVMKQLYRFFFCIGLIALYIIPLSSCSVNKGTAAFRNMSSQQKKDTDSLLAYALDHEALYTLLDTLKPMSSVKLMKLPLLSKDSIKLTAAVYELEKWTTLTQKIQFPDIRFILQPFEKADGDNIYLEIYAVRLSAVQKKLQEQANFYQTIGLNKHASPETILAITEYEHKYRRWRSYGYLFGYPSYAVDFFVEAGQQQDSTGKFVPRDFFAIPVQAANTGYFTYAIPKGHTPGATDSSIYRKAMLTLDAYLKKREQLKKKSLIKHLYKSNKKMYYGK